MTNERLDLEAIRAKAAKALNAFTDQYVKHEGAIEHFMREPMLKLVPLLREDIPGLMDEVDRLREALKGAMVIADEAKQAIKAKKDRRLVELPCNVGDTVYEAVREWDGRDCVRSSFRPCVKASRVCSFHITKSGDPVACLSRTQSYAVFGKYVFLTPEEAGAALETEVNEDAGNGRSDSKA